MVPEGMHFRAVRDIPLPENPYTFAYRAGQLVHESAVEGDGAWLAVGDDVEPVEGATLDIPARNASQSVWAAFMTSRGMDAGKAEGSSRAELLEAFDASPEGVPAPAAPDGGSDGNPDQAAD
jgi:hypothetical protein